MRSTGTWPAATLSFRPRRTCATQMLTSRRRRRVTMVAILIVDTDTLDIGDARRRPASIVGGAGESGVLRCPAAYGLGRAALHWKVRAMPLPTLKPRP